MRHFQSSQHEDFIVARYSSIRSWPSNSPSGIIQTMAGRVIYLNGASSAGKTSIAIALQDVLDDPFIRLGVDTFIAMLPRKTFGTPPFEAAPAGGYRPTAALRDAIRQPMLGALAALVATDDVIVDDVVPDSRWLRSIVHALAPFDVLFVGVHCSIEELERREIARGDRRRGIARGTMVPAHEHGLYDLTVDTSVMTSVECADAIRRRLVDGPSPRAFRELASRL